MDVEPRWPWVMTRIGGRWRPGRLTRWRLHQDSGQWIALVRYGPGVLDWGWFLHTPEVIRRSRQAPEPGR
ncbi:hypothetical protein ACWGB8_27685 [Kitasatospora sp. NPDC054939]